MALYHSLLARFAQNLTILKSSITVPDYSGVVLIIPIIRSPSRKGKSHFIHIINDILINHTKRRYQRLALIKIPSKQI